LEAEIVDSIVDAPEQREGWVVAGRHVAASDTLLCPAIEVQATSAPALLTSVTIS
jgi:hypothetical protein